MYIYIHALFCFINSFDLLRPCFSAMISGRWAIFSLQKGFQKQALWLWTSVVSVLQTKTAVSNNYFLLQASFSPRKTGAHAAPQAQSNWNQSHYPIEREYTIVVGVIYIYTHKHGGFISISSFLFGLSSSCLTPCEALCCQTASRCFDHQPSRTRIYWGMG